MDTPTTDVSAMYSYKKKKHVNNNKWNTTDIVKRENDDNLKTDRGCTMRMKAEGRGKEKANGGSCEIDTSM